MSTSHLETETTFDVGTDFPEHLEIPRRRLPKGAREERVRTRLRSTYFDTADLALLRAGVTLRRREGDDESGWQLKVPAVGGRTELGWPPEAGVDQPPARVARLVQGLAGGDALAAVAVVSTDRTRHRVVRPGADPLGEIDDDRVEATDLRDGRAPVRWREVEVEVGGGGRKVAAALGDLVLARGGTPATSGSKLRRLLLPEPGRRRRPAEDAVQRYVTEQVDALVAGDVALRRGRDAVHATRVGCRRLRSTLRVFADLFDPAAATHLDSELRWWAGELGVARDAQVQRSRHLEALAALPPELVLGPVAARIRQTTTSTEARAFAALQAAADGERYRALLAELRRWRESAPFTPAASAGRKVVRAAAERASDRADKRLRRALRSDDDEALHRARKAAKRARYAHELEASAGGSRRGIKRHKRVQEVLGDHQDAVVAAELLRRLGAAAGAARENGFTYGVLWQREQQAADAARARAHRLR